MFLLPSYSPQLNPDEWVWNNVKNDRIGRSVVMSKDDLKACAVSALRRLQKLPALVRGFFRDPKLAYILELQASADLCLQMPILISNDNYPDVAVMPRSWPGGGVPAGRGGGLAA